MRNQFLINAICAAAIFAAMPALAKDLAYATFTSPNASNNTKGVEPFMKAVTERTNGELTFSFYPGGQIFDARATLTGIGDQLADAGFLVPQFFPKELSNIGVMSDLLMMNEHEVPSAGAFMETMLFECPACDVETKANGIRMLASLAAAPYNIMCRDPIESVADLAGLKFRSTGDALGRVTVAWGGVPVSMSSGEIYEGLQRGQLDCAVAPRAWLISFGLADVVKFIYDIPIGAAVGPGLFTINDEIWEGLPRDHKIAILTELPGLLAGAIMDGYGGDTADAITLAGEKDIAIVQAPAELVALMDTVRLGEAAQVAKKARSRGVENPEALIAAYTKNLAFWEDATKDIRTDRKAYEALLWERIYSRLVADLK
ncbi:MAG: C4-dicarboxylate TRAP transporter substrate-binding protein [Marinosulfonomonas sp.]|nr:C4-dicarboxylate TRAP transporter substrate-binding protein [Marinosulfonomonas sp.]